MQGREYNIFLFTSYNNSLWSATEGWITVTENIATSNPLQERRHGMKTETVLLVLYGKTSHALTLYIKPSLKHPPISSSCCTYHQPFFMNTVLASNWILGSFDMISHSSIFMTLPQDCIVKAQGD